MTTYLLTWNPERWPWHELADDVEQVKRNGHLASRWSCGNTKRIVEGDRVFLLRQGSEPRGLIASGWVTGETFEDTHWEDSSRTGLFVAVDFDALQSSPIISRSELDAAPLGRVNWDSPASGISMIPQVARFLEAEWGRRVGSHFEPLPDEVDEAVYFEGAVKRITVNAYERDAQARAKCIAHYRCRCVVCNFDFQAAYGEDAAGLIHVHHLEQLSQLGKQHRVDPIQHLRPVCPNCHAVIHRRNPCYSIEDVIAMRQRASESRGSVK